MHPPTSPPISLLFRLLLLLPLLFLPPPSFSLSPTTRCSSETPQNHCRCSLHQTSPTFCLSTTPTHCIQHPCPARHVCDCAGDTLCRITLTRTIPICLQPLSAHGTCPCQRSTLAVNPGTAPLTTLIPLRPFRPLLHEFAQPFCTERPSFWAQLGSNLVAHYWHLFVGSYPHRPDSLSLGHPGHLITFRSASAVISTLSTESHHHPSHPISTQLQGELRDPKPDPHASNPLVNECVAMWLAVRLAEHGIATRGGIAVEKCDALERWVLKPCSLLSATNPAAGMSVRRLLERVHLATGQFALDDAGLSQGHVVEACRAVNRNFELCQVDLGCIAVVEE